MKEFNGFRVIWALFLILGSVNRSFFSETTLAKADQPGLGQLAHYIVFEKYPTGGIFPVYYRLVELTSALQPVSDAQLVGFLAQPSRNIERIIVALRAQDGKTVYQNLVEIHPWLRGEFQGASAGDPIDGHIIPAEKSAFVVRMPSIAGTTLVLKDARMATLAEFDLRRLAAETPRIQIDRSRLFASQATGGPASNRVDFLVMGDGYTSAETSKFSTDASNLMAQFFNISPYSEYQNYYNIHILFSASNQSGADHPAYNPSCGYNDPTCCGDTTMNSDPLRGQMVDTAFDSRYCAYFIHRLIVSNYSKVLAAAAAVPDWDTIMLIVNDTTYGGSGGQIATISTNSYATQIAQHEFGHSFIDLADEYAAPYPGYPPCSDLSGTHPCEANVTDVTARAQIKWYPWILDSTPIPTPNDNAYHGLVGLFQGARYRTSGMYRSGYICMMQSLGAPFCQVPSQAYVLKLYQGGWGIPAGGISLIEPGTTSPASPVVNLTHPASQVLHADLLGPVGGPPLQVIWLKNGLPIPGAITTTYTYTTSVSEPGSTQIRLQVKDMTTLVHPVMAGSALQDEYTWNINVTVLPSITVTLYLPSIFHWDEDK
jgi:hypothetical protein